MAKVTPSIVSRASLDQAAAGNPSLRNILNRLITAQNTQATKTSTSGKNPPTQSTATVTYQSPFYIVTFIDPGGATAATAAQAAQQAANSPLGSNAAQSVIYHQVQAANTLLFDASANVTTYGGDTGTLQTQLVCSGLDDTKQWYFRYRTSYDGQTWGQYRTISKDAVQGNPNAVSLLPILGGQSAAITLPGGQSVSFGVSSIQSGQAVETAGGVLLENAIGLAGPATYTESGHRVVGINTESIDALGQLTLLYQNGGSAFVTWVGGSNILTFGAVLNQAQNLTLQTLSDGGKWYIMTVAGGGQIAIGQGLASAGTAVALPAGFSCPNAMGIATPAADTYTTDNLAHGIKTSQIDVTSTSLTPNVSYGDGSGNTWPGNANWFAMAWVAGLAANVVSVDGGHYLIVPTPSGQVAIGIGQTASGGILPLPPGYTWPKCLAFATMGGYNDIGSYMHGVKVCAIDAGSLDSIGTVTGIYSDGTEAVWDGPVNWFAIAWL